jgi:hypothetical protein
MAIRAKVMGTAIATVAMETEITKAEKDLAVGQEKDNPEKGKAPEVAVKLPKMI